MRIWSSLKLRSKLALVSLVLLLLPWLGVRYIQAMETLLQQQQANSMAIIAKASAVLVEHYPQALIERSAILDSTARIENSGIKRC
ncbi:MAG: hypothetical protein Q9N32_05460 [Gammaproteobacteria bacterium]|nr:hypothetical protein [Gammaproteobacteria bacterium]